ncbi:MAG TPA: hypothetical protein VFC99_03170 [Acidimicrobiia bacterium]|nr:hypothetical protein [Acidimicrobiia bacterium]
MVRKGEPWGAPASGPPDLEVRGGDAELAAAARDHPGARVRFVPDATSDLARAVGIGGTPREQPQELPLDALALDGLGADTARLAVNMVVLGVAPDRLRAWSRSAPCHVTIDGRAVFEGPATTVVVANGQFLGGLDVVPRGHPGDGRCEVQVYAMRPAARRAMRARLPSGTHVPHPGIHQFAGRSVAVRFARPRPLAIDGRSRPPRPALALRVVPEAVVVLA